MQREIYIGNAQAQASTRIAAIAVSAQSIRVQFVDLPPHWKDLPVVRFARTRLPGVKILVDAMRNGGSNDEFVALADACRVAAYRYGNPCKGRIV
jgi:hypothetical protein